MFRRLAITFAICLLMLVGVQAVPSVQPLTLLQLSGALSTAPSAGYCSTSALAGTSAGSCKIVLQCGTSTTPITLIDNVGSGCSSSTPTPAFVQDKSAQIGSDSLTVTFTATVGTGHLLAGEVTWDASTSGTITSIELGSTVGSCTVVDTTTDTPDTEKTSSFYCPNTAASQTAVHIVISSGSFTAAYIDEYSGVLTASPLDVHTAQLLTSVGTGANAITSGSTTTTTNGDLVWGGTFNTATAATATVGTGFTIRGNNALAGVVGYSEDLVKSSAGGTAATFTAATSGGSWNTFVMAFKP